MKIIVVKFIIYFVLTDIIYTQNVSNNSNIVLLKNYFKLTKNDEYKDTNHLNYTKHVLNSDNNTKEYKIHKSNNKNYENTSLKSTKGNKLSKLSNEKVNKSFKNKIQLSTSHFFTSLMKPNISISNRKPLAKESLSTESVKSTESSIFCPPSTTPNCNDTWEDKTRHNIGHQHPSIGQLVIKTVEINSSPILRCSQQPLKQNDKVQIILWYINDLAEPIVRYDVRNPDVRNQHSITKTENLIPKFNEGDITQRIEIFENEEERFNRLFVGSKGDFLMFRNVSFSDQAEYKCEIYYKLSPPFLYRWRLVVKEYRGYRSIQVIDKEQNVIGHTIGPFSDGTPLFLSCKAKLGKCKYSNMEWILQRKSLSPISESFSGELFYSELNTTLHQSDAYSIIYCRSTCVSSTQNGDIFTAEKSTLLRMFYIPQIKLSFNSKTTEINDTNESANKYRRTRAKIVEGQNLEFLCVIKSNPPFYDIFWLKNGKVITESKSMNLEGPKFQIVEVQESDTGIYTCLASNGEGDGQSNALFVEVLYSPKCSTSVDTSMIVPMNRIVFLECNYEAMPDNLTFIWHKIKLDDKASLYKRLHNGHGGIITGEEQHVSSIPKYIDLMPTIENIIEKKVIYKELPSTEGPSLDYHTDSELPTRSFLEVVPQKEIEGYVCFARNQIGHSMRPCIFTLNVIAPPKPPERCRIEEAGINFLSVRCNFTPINEHMMRNHFFPKHSIVSKETKLVAVLEVWSLGTLVANLTSYEPLWYVEELTPDSDFRLRIYSSFFNTHSTPVVLYAHTESMHRKIIEDKSSFPEIGNQTDYLGEQYGLEIELMIGMISALLTLLILVGLGLIFAMKIICKRKSRHKSQSRNKEESEAS